MAHSAVVRGKWRDFPSNSSDLGCLHTWFSHSSGLWPCLALSHQAVLVFLLKTFDKNMRGVRCEAQHPGCQRWRPAPSASHSFFVLLRKDPVGHMCACPPWLDGPPIASLTHGVGRGLCIPYLDSIPVGRLVASRPHGVVTNFKLANLSNGSDCRQPGGLTSPANSFYCQGLSPFRIWCPFQVR